MSFSSINPSNPLCEPFGLQTGVRWVYILLMSFNILIILKNFDKVVDIICKHGWK